MGWCLICFDNFFLSLLFRKVAEIALHYNFERYPCSVRFVVITVFVVYGWLPHVHFAFYVGLGSQIGSTSRKKR
jgi:hypothetical protein